jgi:hypothetical protein
MIARFPHPSTPRSPGQTPDEKLALHSGESRAEHDESLSWVRWLFQGVRAHCEYVLFVTDGEAGRHSMVKDWEAFLDGPWKSVVAPGLLAGWRAADAGDLEALLAENARMGSLLPEEARERSLVAGELLLRSTRGAKYQGVLGHLRQRVESDGLEVHLLTVWAAVSVVFQLPVADVVGEYLREEWMTATGRYAHHADPQGLLSFAATAHRTLREAGFHELQIWS